VSSYSTVHSTNPQLNFKKYLKKQNKKDKERIKREGNVDAF